MESCANRKKIFPRLFSGIGTVGRKRAELKNCLSHLREDKRQLVCLSTHLQRYLNGVDHGR